MKKEVKLGYTNWSENSDKVYKVHMHQDDGMYTVFVKYGPRGRIGNYTTKLSTSNINNATKTYYQLIESKLKKGYEIEEETR
jgi:predicted DNA-binding WGR domain protein